MDLYSSSVLLHAAGSTPSVVRMQSFVDRRFFSWDSETNPAYFATKSFHEHHCAPYTVNYLSETPKAGNMGNLIPSLTDQLESVPDTVTAWVGVLPETLPTWWSI